jgi:putative peptidoglycan lipid II flippase
VNQLPLGVVAAALGTALLPLLSRQLRAGNDAAAMHNQNRAIELAMLLTLPAVAALTAIGRPIIAVLFERGAFDAADTTATVAALRAYAFGLPAFCLIKVLAPGFFARQDTRTPVVIAVVSLVANIGLTAALIGPLAHVGIALASALSNWLNAALLGLLLHRRGHLRLDARLSERLPRIALAALLMGLGLWGLDFVMAAVPKPVALAVLIAAGLTGFGLLAQATGGADLREVAGTLRRRA